MKLTLLSSIAISSTLLWGVIQSFAAFITDHWYYEFIYIIMNIDVMINLLCLYLQFCYGLNDYNKYCSKCHLCFYQCSSGEIQIQENDIDMPAIEIVKSASENDT